MKLKIHNSWETALKNEIEKPYFKRLLCFIKNEYHNHQCFPPQNKIFRAFNQCPFHDIKVVIIGQDPYHQRYQANGLCFSVSDGVKHPPSLVNILKEIENDIGMILPASGNLERWSRQGVLLLNSTLTVRENMAASHQGKGWEIFTDAVINLIDQKKHGIIFLLWGRSAQKKTNLINDSKHHVLTCGHPSPLSANRGFWFGNKHFSKANYLLEKANQTPIAW